MFEEFMSLLEGSMFGGSAANPDSKEQAAPAAPKPDNSSIGASIGSTAGAVAGSIFGPVGTAAGSALGGWAGKQVEAAGGAPRGPGATIESGTADTSQRSIAVDSAISVGQSLQQMAFRGLTQQPAASGEGKKF